MADFLSESTPLDASPVAEGAGKVREMKEALNIALSAIFSSISPTATFLTKWVLGAHIANDASTDANRAIGSDHIKNSAVITRALVDGVLSADTTGRAKMADDYVLPEHVEYDPPTLSTSGSVTLDWSASFTQAVTLTDNITFTFSNKKSGQSLILAVKQATGGSKTVTFVAGDSDSIVWKGGTTPTQTATASKTDIYTFLKVGTTIYGVAQQGF